MGASWTLQTLLREMAGRGDHPAVMTVRDGVVTSHRYAEVAAEAQRLASGLAAAGVAPGEPVALYAPNSVAWIVVRLALGACGALSVPLDDLWSEAEARNVLRHCGARRVFCTAEHLPLVLELREELALQPILLEESEDDSARDLPHWRSFLAGAPGPLPALDGAAPDMVLHTSGTTGRPKAFTLSFDNIAANVLALVSERMIGPDDRLLLPLPLHHVYPEVVGLFTPLAAGSTVVLPESVAGPQILQALAAARVTTMIGVPRLYTALAGAIETQVVQRGRLVAAVFNALHRLAVWTRRRLGVDIGGVLFRPLRARLGPQLRLLVSGGAKVDPAVLWRLIGLGWDLRSGYGLAETASTITGNLPGRERLGSEGKPFQGGEVRIADPDTQGMGEILFRGPNVFAGYQDNPDANRAAFTDDGWFHTGDLGYLDADGYLFVTGRAKEMIVLGGGKNVFPEELEKIYGTSQIVEEIAVLERDGALVALVRPDLKALQAAGTTRADEALRVALTEIGQGLPSFQRLAGYALAREPLPRTRLGKYQRFLLPQLYAEARSGASRKAAALSAEDKALLARPRVAPLWALLQTRYRERLTGPDASLALDLGIDSLEWVSLALELEQRLDLAVDEADMAALLSVRDLLLLAEARAAGTPPAAAAVPDVEAWLAPTGPGLVLLGRMLYWVNRLVFRGLFGLRGVSPDVIPVQGPFVLVANHVSDLDPFVLAAALPFSVVRRVYWGAEISRLYGNALARAFCRAAHIFPVNEMAPAATLATAAGVLDRGHALIWFPESWRSPDGELQRFLPGIGRLTEGREIDVVPAFVSGTFEAMPRGRRLPRLRRVSVRLGPPARPDRLSAEGTGEETDARIADALRGRVAALAPPHGPSS